MLTDKPSIFTRPWLTLFIKTGSILALAMVGLGVIGLLVGQWWTKENLAPLVAKELTKTLDRAIDVGKVEELSWNRLVFGKSSVAATAGDRSKIDLDRIEINFDPVKVVTARTLKLDVKVTAPQVYLERGNDGSWLKLPKFKSAPAGDFKTQVGRIQIDDGRAVLLANSKSPATAVAITGINGAIDLNETQQQLMLGFVGEIDGGGKLDLRGESAFARRMTKINLRGEKLAANRVSNILAIPMVSVDRGTVDGAIELAIEPNKPLALMGTALLKDARLKIAPVPKAFDRTNGLLQITERQVKFNNVTTQFDRIGGLVNGSIDFQSGYQLNAKTRATRIEDLLTTIDLKSTVSLQGAAVAELNLGGKLDRPILTGRFINSQPVQIDRVTSDRASGNFKLADGNVEIGATLNPWVGGQIFANGNVSLSAGNKIQFRVRGNDIDGDKLGTLYNVSLPAGMAIGKAIVDGVVSGEAGNINTDLNIAANEATYPTTANINIDRSLNIKLRHAETVVGGGKVRSSGSFINNNWQVDLATQSIDGGKLATLAGTSLLPQYAGKLAGNIRLNGSIDPNCNSNCNSNPLDRLQATGSLNYRLPAGNIAVDRLTVDGGKWQSNISTSAIDLAKIDASLPQGKLSGKFKLQGDRIDNIDPDRIIAAGIGKINFGDGREVTADRLVINNGSWQGNFTARNLAISEFNPQVQGNLDGKFTLAGNTANFSPKSIAGAGNAVISLPQGKITANNFQIDRGKYRSNLSFNALALAKLLPQIDRQLSTAKIDGNFNLSGEIDRPNLNSIALSGSGKIQLDRGSVTASNLQIDRGKWAGNFNLDRLPLSIAKGAMPAGLLIGTASGNFSAAGELANPTVDRLRLAGSGKIDLGDSLVSGDRIQLNHGNWQGNLKLRNFALARLDNLPRQVRGGRLTGDFNLAGNLNELTPTAIDVTGSGKLAINGGTISTPNLQLTQGNLQSDLAISNIKLGDFNPQLPNSIRSSRISGNFRTAGNLNNFTPEQIALSGNGKINNILGGKIDLTNLNLDRGNWQGKVTADRLNIASIKQFAPNEAKLPDIAGKLSGNWQLGGNIKELSAGKLQANGNTQLTDLSIGELKFYPRLAGDVRIDPTAGVLVALAGGSDRFDFQLDRNMQPQAFNLQQQEVTATGNVNGKVIDVRVAKLPVSFMQKFIPANMGLNQYRWQGECSGNLQVNMTTAAIAGRELVIDKPVFGAFTGDRLTGNFRYSQGQLELDRATLDRDKYQYAVSGKIDPNNRAFDLTLDIPQGRLADIRNLLQINSNRDLFTPLNRRKYGTAKDLGKAGIGYRQPEIQRESLDDTEETANKPAADLLPDLGNIDGDFSGSIVIANRPKSGIKSTFDLAGSNWYIDKYKLDRVQVNGKWENGRLLLLPLNITKANTVFNLSGNFGLDRQTGDIQIQNAPVTWTKKFIDLPVDIAGGVNLQAKLDGNIFDPQINGKISLNNPHIDRTKLDTASGNFNYRDGRLAFDARATFPNDKPNLDLDRIAIVGSIPYRLPLSKAAPDPNLNIEIDLADRGMQAIDVFSKQQLRWLDGKGSVDVKVTGKVNNSGKIENLTASGTAEIINAKINSTALAAPLTNVNGQILFDLDRIDVQKLTGTLDRGQISIAGLLPISENFTLDKAQRLSIVMQSIPLDIPAKYQGNIDGNISFKGTALKPTIGGNITLSNGQVFLPDTSADTEDIIKGIQPEPTKKTAQTNNNIQLKKLQVILGENLQINRPPVLSFVAKGTLDIEGTVEQPRPFGQVTLQKGAVNLFTTQFRLANGYPQTADFFPTLGPDPVLNIRLQAKILESNANPLAQRNSIARTPKGNEINETVDFYSTSLGSVQTVQIEAKIAGLASQVTQRLELNSTPPRTQPEILLLLGGGLVERLGGANNDIGLGIVNLAGSTLLNNIQDRISDTLSLSDFRLFPTVSKEAKTSSGSTLGIAAEVGLDLTPKISTSVFKIITNSELPQYSLRYRIDDRLLLRGSTNLFGDNRATIEFEQRF